MPDAATPEPTATSAGPLTDRIAGAPISWGVCEVPGWGYQLSRERVFAEMRDLGLSAAEFGPDGFLPDSPAERAAFLADHGLHAVGGFVPVLLHDSGHDPLPEVDVFIDACLAAGAGVVVLAAATGVAGYDARPVLNEAQWTTLLGHLDRLADHARSRGVLAVVHPHLGTVVESADDVQRVLDGSRIGLCVDTGHLTAAGADPVALTAAHPERVAHVHLKDVDAELAAQVVAGGLPFSDAVSRGLFTVLGEGSVDVAAMVRVLEGSGYRGYYVLEQDLKLAAAPEGDGPVADVRRCRDYLLHALEEAHA